MSAPSTNDLRRLIREWNDFERSPDNPDDERDIGYAFGVEMGHQLAAHDLQKLLESYGEK